MRTYAWLVVCGVMVSATVASAQPMVNPYGLPGYPTPPYGPPVPAPPNLPPIPAPPTAPYAMPPGAPNGFPMPMIGRTPNGQAMPMYGPPMMMPNGQAMPMYGPPMMMPNGQAMPMYGPPMMMPNGQAMPRMPYANPAPVMAPPDPRLPVGPGPSALSPYNGSGPQKDATEPYFVLPDSVPSTRGALTPDAQPSTSGSVITEPLARFVQFVTDPTASEPYTTYEGRRYRAEERLDNSRVWVQANFIHWWVRRDNTPPLVTSTTGDPTMTAGLAALGRSDTILLLGGGAIGPKEFSGIQATLGMWLDPERLRSLEVGGFWVGKNSRQYRFASDANGNPLIAQPVISPPDGPESAFPVSFPGSNTGTISVNTIMDFHGLELNLVRNVIRLNGWSLDSIVGLRYLYLNDRLDIHQNLTLLPGGAGSLSFNGVPQPAGANFVFDDSFNLTNRFYGAQIGARLNWAYNRLDLGAVFKVAFGATSHVAVINGATTLNAIDGTTSTAVGGSLAQPSNIGRFTGTNFSVVPEVTLTLGYQVTCNLRVLAGYTAIDWTRIQRAGDQIDRRIDQTQSPTGGVAVVPGTVGTAPTFPGVRADFWAQGINLGIELKY